MLSRDSDRAESERRNSPVRASDCSDALATLEVGVPTDSKAGASGWFLNRIMAYVYILESKKNGNFYVGSTDNFQQRLRQHKTGQVRTTLRLLPVDLVFKQECSSIDLAKKVERRIKNLKRRDYIQKIIDDGYIKIIDRL